MSEPPYVGPPSMPSGPDGGWYQPPRPWQAPPPPYPAPPPAYAAPPPAHAAGEWEELGGTPPTPFAPKPRGRRRLVTSAAAVIALVAGGVVTYVAVSDTSQHGASSPQAAIQTIVNDINASDFVGILDDLAPAERDAVATPLLKDIDELKRIDILDPSANPQKVDAVTASITKLTFGAPVPINDHVQIVQLTGGTVMISADASKIPFTKDLVNTLFPNGLPKGTGNTSTTDIAKAVAANGGTPIRVAAEKVGGRWYPSLFYTIADNAANSSGAGNPTAADFVAAHGGVSPIDAVTKIVRAALGGDVRTIISLLSPTELAVVHDYAGLIMSNGNTSYSPAPITLDDLELSATPVPGGAQRVTLNKVTLTNQQGTKISIALEGDCVVTTSSGQPSKRVCAAQTAADVTKEIETLAGRPLTAGEKAAFDHLLTGDTAVGVITTESGGLWYVNPVQTIFDETTSLLSALQGDDVIQLIHLIRSLGN